MLNQLIESKNNNAENSRKNGFLVMTFGIFVAVLVSGWTYSLFAKNYGMGTGEFELSKIVAPVALTTDAPPPPKVEIIRERTTQTSSDKIILRELFEDISRSTKPPKDLSGEKNVVNAEQFDLGKVKRGEFNQIPATIGRSDTTQQQESCGLCNSEGDGKVKKEKEEIAPEVKVKATPKVAPTPDKNIIRSIGVVNGKAIYLAMPVYPVAAKTIRVEGAVNVQVLIDEKGNVVSASVISGHPLLRAVAVKAARESRFTPTLLSNQPVKVTGVIVYNFKQ